MGEPGAREVVLPGHDDLGLVGQAAERIRVQHAGTVAGELATDDGRAGAFRRFRDAPGPRRILVRRHSQSCSNCSSTQLAKRTRGSIHAPTVWWIWSRLAPT